MNSTATTTYQCSRCGGSGRLSVFGHVLGGTCFKCNGTGKQRHKPAQPAAKWAVFGLERETGRFLRLYNVNARTAEQAIEKAHCTFAGASTLFKDSYTLDGARAVRWSDMANVSAESWEVATRGAA